VAEDSGRLETDPLFLALTRPAMVFGITYSWFFLELLTCMLYFIQTSSFKVVIYFLLMHSVGVLVCGKEPRFLEVIGTWAKASSRCLNKRYHGGTSSYDMF